MGTENLSEGTTCTSCDFMAPQRGAALFVVVIVSLLVSLMGAQLVNRLVFGNRGAMFEQDVALARAAAEATLRDAENDIRCRQWVGASANYQFVANSSRPAAQQRPHCDKPTTDPTQTGGYGLTFSCVNGFILKDPAASAPSSTPFSTTPCQVPYGKYTKAPAFTTGGLSSANAFYTVEVLLVPNGQVGQSVPYYRIRATSYGRNSTTKVTLEAMFRPI